MRKVSKIVAYKLAVLPDSELKDKSSKNQETTHHAHTPMIDVAMMFVVSDSATLIIWVSLSACSNILLFEDPAKIAARRMMDAMMETGYATS